MITNATRAANARFALIEYRNVSRSEESEELLIQDFLSDLMHLCDILELDLEDLHRRAANNYNEERKCEG